MKLVSKKTIVLDKPEKVYEVVASNPRNNYILSNGAVSHNCGLMDEIEFLANQNTNMAKSGAMGLYNTIKRRMQSRFMKSGGTLPGVLFLVSSKSESNNFLEQYIKTVDDVPSTLVIDEPVWNIKPSETYSGKTFKLALGSKYVKSRIMDDNEVVDIEELHKMGYEDVLDVPVEYKRSFELDMDSAIRDIAGRSTSDAVKFISPERLRNIYTLDKESNPFTQEVLVIGMNDSLAISDFFRPDRIPDEIKKANGFIHIDGSLTGDKTGISYVANVERSSVERYDNETQTTKRVLDNYYRQVFSVAIQAPNGSEIQLSKTREFIYYLTEEGFNIKFVSLDGFQSADSRQQLEIAGYKSKIVSLDRNDDGYITLRTAINEGRLAMYDSDNSLLETELVNVERTPKGKIDHTPDGSKDIADSLAGAVFGASKDGDVVKASGLAELNDLMEDIPEVLGSGNLDYNSEFGGLDGRVISSEDSASDAYDELSRYL